MTIAPVVSLELDLKQLNFHGPVAQLARASDWQSESRGFESHRGPLSHVKDLPLKGDRKKMGLAVLVVIDGGMFLT